MKKLLAIGLLAILGLTACSQPTSQNQVFGSNTQTVMSVAQVKTLADDSLVQLEGNIVRQVKGEDYIFADQSGEIQVEIDHHIWNGLNVTPKDKVRLSGKLDKEMFNSSVDVKQIEKIQ